MSDVFTTCTRFDNSAVIFPTALIVRRLKHQKDEEKSDRTGTCTKFEAARTTSGEEQGARELEGKDGFHPRVKPHPNFSKYGVTEVRSRHRTTQTQNT